MRPEDFQVLSQVSRALWSQEDYGRRTTVETLTAVSLLELSEDRATEKATQALLEKANRDGAEANSAALNHAFFRLIPEERLALAALHLAHWSYARLARIFGVSEHQVAVVAWSARLRLASFNVGKRPLYYPSQSAVQGMNCPEYDLAAPWTQKFLDEEMPARERIFLQNHIMACDSCRKSIMSARDLYFRVDAMLPVPRDQTDASILSLSKILERTWSDAYSQSRDSLPSFLTAIKRFVAKPSVFAPLVVGVMVLTYLIVGF